MIGNKVIFITDALQIKGFMLLWSVAIPDSLQQKPISDPAADEVRSPCVC